MKKGVKPTIQNSNPMNLNQVNFGNNLLEIRRENILSDMITYFGVNEPKLNTFSLDNKI
tara:strand:+ start:1767 stop:1943 length:177 start_codon:yes stop_codon:yes gene_type:complete